jgi:outer membrane lipoprotein SlyB
MQSNNNKVSPIVAIAAASVILFSAVGIGVMTGVIPSSMSKSAETPAPVEAPQAAAPAPATPVEQPKTTTQRKTEPARVASTEPAPRTAAASKPRQGICSNCGSVVSVDAVKQQGEGSGLGAVAGGVAGGVLGNQIGRGTGRTVATVVGVAGGAYAGHEVEKHVKSTNTYVVAVRMDDGSNRTFNYDTMPAYRAGDKVKVVEGGLVRQ